MRREELRWLLAGKRTLPCILEDTVNAGDGLVDPRAAEILVEEGPWRVEELLSWGTNFDRKNGQVDEDPRGRS